VTVSEPAAKQANGQYANLINDKAWEVLGLTGQEFLLQYYSRSFVDHEDPKVRALVYLLEHGHWPDGSGAGDEVPAPRRPSRRRR
jgi:hypothetical protein